MFKTTDNCKNGQKAMKREKKLQKLVKKNACSLEGSHQGQWKCVRKIISYPHTIILFFKGLNVNQCFGKVKGTLSIRTC